jgi:putative ABC transport system permease protein
LVEPLALFNASSKTYNLHTSYVSIRLQPGNINEQISRIEAEWKSFAPATPFDFSFLDREFDALYRSEQQMGAGFGMHVLVDIFSCRRIRYGDRIDSGLLPSNQSSDGKPRKGLAF